jgi:hypothetical protein
VLPFIDALNGLPILCAKAAGVIGEFMETGADLGAEGWVGERGDGVGRGGADGQESVFEGQ